MRRYLHLNFRSGLKIEKISSSNNYLENGKMLEEAISKVNASIDESKFYIDYSLKNQVKISNSRL